MLLTFLLVVVTVLLARCLLQMYKQGWSFSKVTCYLCMERVSKRAWMSGKHRQDCMMRLSETIHQFAAHPILRCQHCKAQLRLWPEGPDFLCDGQQCADSGEKIRNNGKNR